MNEEVQLIQSKVEREYPFVERLKVEMKKVIVGQEEMLNGLLIGLITGGHVLVEGVPGLAKRLQFQHFRKFLRLILNAFNLHPIYCRQT